MKWKYGVSRLNANTVIILEYRPAIGVLTPLALLTAERVNAPQTGIDLKKDPTTLHKPSVIISWLASTVSPFAFGRKENNENEENNFHFFGEMKSKHLLNAFAIATFAKTATNGTTIIPVPNSLHTSLNDNVRLL